MVRCCVGLHMRPQPSLRISQASGSEGFVAVRQTMSGLTLIMPRSIRVTGTLSDMTSCNRAAHLAIACVGLARMSLYAGVRKALHLYSHPSS